jgi:hypothetical protein
MKYYYHIYSTSMRTNLYSLEITLLTSLESWQYEVTKLILDTNMYIRFILRIGKGTNTNFFINAIELSFPYKRHKESFEII